MSRRLPPDQLTTAVRVDASSMEDQLPALLGQPRTVTQRPPDEGRLVIGELIGLTDEGLTPLVLYPGQPGSAALRARTLADLHGAHVGRSVALMFEDADPHRPIVMGVLQEGASWPLAERPAQVEVDADGERLVIEAREQLVLRCGKASITLTKSGKVLIQGAYVSTRSSGVNRIKGGSVQIN